jgi:site-specific DNA-cytosine methylase
MSDALPHLGGQVKQGPTDEGWDKHPAWNPATAPSLTVGASAHSGNGRFPMGVVEHLVVKQWSAPVPPQAIDSAAPTITATGMLGVSRSEATWASKSMFVKPFGSWALKEISLSEPVYTVMAHGMSGVGPSHVGFEMFDASNFVDPETGEDLMRVSEKLKSQYPDRFLRKISIAELRRLCSYPDDFKLQGSYGQRWERLGRSVPPVMMKHIAESVVGTLCAD